MGAPVDLVLQAQDDLREIVAFIARNNQARAESFGDMLYEKAMSLGNHPMMGRVVPELHDDAIREIIHGAYRIICEVFANPEMITALRFWHAARGAPQVVED